MERLDTVTLPSIAYGLYKGARGSILCVNFRQLAFKFPPGVVTRSRSECPQRSSRHRTKFVVANKPVPMRRQTKAFSRMRPAVRIPFAPATRQRELPVPSGWDWRKPQVQILMSVFILLAGSQEGFRRTRRESRRRNRKVERRAGVRIALVARRPARFNARRPHMWRHQGGPAFPPSGGALGAVQLWTSSLQAKLQWCASIAFPGFPIATFFLEPAPPT
jgi:hypothetical protein